MLAAIAGARSTQALAAFWISATCLSESAFCSDLGSDRRSFFIEASITSMCFWISVSLPSFFFLAPPSSLLLFPASSAAWAAGVRAVNGRAGTATNAAAASRIQRLMCLRGMVLLLLVMSSERQFGAGRSRPARKDPVEGAGLDDGPDGPRDCRR